MLGCWVANELWQKFGVRAKKKTVAMNRLYLLCFLVLFSTVAWADFGISCSDIEYTQKDALEDALEDAGLTKETIVVDSGRGQFMLQVTYPENQESRRYEDTSRIYWLPIRRAVTTQNEYVYNQNHHFESDISSIFVDRRINYIKVKYTTRKPQIVIKDAEKVEIQVREREYRNSCRLLDADERLFVLNIAKDLQQKSRKYGTDRVDSLPEGKPVI